MNRVIAADNLSSMLSRSRKEAGQSQKFMAKALGKSLGTISNWEMGLGSPNLIDTVEWFNALGLNFISYWIRYMEEESPEGKIKLILTKSQSEKLLQCMENDKKNDLDQILNTMLMLYSLSERDKSIVVEIIQKMYSTK